MRRIALLLVCSFWLAEASAARLDEKTRMIPNVNLKVIRSMCGSAGDLRACTAFRTEKLDARCVAAGSAWRIEAQASYEPTIYLSENGWIAHEMLHISDVRVAVESYLDQLTSREFESTAACEGVVRVDTAVFPHRMNTFKDDSNTKRHPGYVRQNKYTVR